MNITETKFMQNFIRFASDACKKGWHERNGGNLSYRIAKEEISEVDLNENNNRQPTGISAPKLAGEYFLVTGSGKYLKNIESEPEKNIAVIKLDEKGENFSVVWGLTDGGKPTSELPTHLLNHNLKRKRIVYHAHPANIIALSYVLPLTDKDFTKELWQSFPEYILVFPEGVGVVPWMIPGGSEIANVTIKLMEKYNAVIWAHHGIFVCGESFDETLGLTEVIEKAAEIAVKVRSMGDKKQCVTENELIELALKFKVDLNRDLL